MTTTTLRTSPRTGAHATATQRVARHTILSRLRRIQHGGFVIADPLGTTSVGPDATRFEVTIHDLAFYTELLARGALAAGETYANGLWDTEDLTAAIRVFVQNRDVLEALDGGVARASRLLFRAALALRGRSRRQSKQDITFHYDLGNELFALLLDETMTYSAGVFTKPDDTLAEASTEKYDRICRKLSLQPGHHVLEIGCGWGGFAEHAARHYGCRVTGTTISDAQRTYALERVRRVGLEERVTILDQDYRDLRGTFDRVVSIEMAEAIGHKGLPALMRVISERLADDGLAAIQAITIADGAYDRARRTMDFIKRHIFPGSCIPSVAAMTAAMASDSDMRLTHLEDIGLHYAETLHRWDVNMQRNAGAIRALGFDDRFLRLWQYYFRYCEAGFRERYLSNVQMLLAKPGSRTPPPLV